MAVLQMQHIVLCGQKKDRKQILEFLQRRGVVEVNDMLQEDSIFHKTDVTAAKLSFDKSITNAKDALEILNQYAPEKKSKLDMLNGRVELSKEGYDEFSTNREDTLRIANRLISLSKEIAENNAEINKLQIQQEMLLPWTSLDIPINFQGTKFTKSFIGILPGTWSLEAIYEKLAELTPINVDIISSSREQTCIFILCKRNMEGFVYDALRDIGFTLPSQMYDHAPYEQLKLLENQIKELQAAIYKAQDEIVSYEKVREDIRLLQDYDTMRADKYEVIGHLLQSKNVFFLTGYIPEKDANSLSEELTKQFDIGIEFDQPAEEEDVPVLLKNNGFSGPLEGVLTGYSLPNRHEVDPTMMMSLFYYVFFGIMLSDAGYGALMVIGCAYALIRFKKTLEHSMKNTLKMYLYCGISTVFWGIAFGSYFGDIVDVVSDTFFGNKIVIPPLWFFPVKEPMRMLTYAMLFGLIHLMFGLFMKFYQTLRLKDYKSLIYDVVFWIVLIISSTVGLLSTEMVRNILGVGFTIPGPIAFTAGILVILSSIGIVLTNGRESKNPFKRFLKGAYALYGITGYLSDVLSYSRLLALGLATGVIATVINKMAAMAGGGFGFVGPILFIAIVLLGHTLNIAINALGAYVHTNRLQYVEFFGKFYEGGGRMFNPFGMKTKYYKIKEKM
ncbi:MAG: hypothetical protein K0S47_3754 [Herbinix sp.]|jgi:V/A-type H+-transporting ATPase subunit I|nr:hypothetical protein [Herbinix sp.]